MTAITCKQIAVCTFAATFLIISTVGAADQKFGSLTLCPAGGRSFMMAWSLACEMKKRRKRSTMENSVAKKFLKEKKRQEFIEESSESRNKRMAPGYRPATLTEIQKICCEVGCEIKDLLSYCDPFGPWNSRK